VKRKAVKSKPYPAAHSIGRLISLTSLKLQPLLEQRVRDQGVSYSTFFFLRALWEGEGVSQGELSSRVVASAPTTMAALYTLKDAGLVTIKDDPRDGRRTVIGLTARGRAMERILLPRLARLNRQLLDGLSRQDVAALRRMLRTIQENAKRAA
jgi:MarR family transcriptional regulator, organic hydroperoxide resistance regulator